MEILWQALSLLLLAQAETPLTSSADAMVAAHRDLQRQPPEIRQYLRYLSLHHLSDKERAETIPILSGHVQHLSRASDLTRPGAVAGGMLLRVNLEDYGWTAATWDKLADPYFTTSIVTEHVEYEPWYGGTWQGKYYGPGKWKYVTKKKVQALAPWLSEWPSSPALVAELAAWTGSKVPVVRADWFVNQTAAQVDRNPGYYDFLRIKTVDDFEKLIGFNRKQSEDFRVELREAVALSGVTLQPRAIARWDTIGGGYWRSFDFKIAKDNKNPLKVLGKEIEDVADASEAFGSLANGFWATYAADNKGKLQAAAPGDIATDHGSKSNDRQVHCNISCLRCHGDGGLKEIDGWTRNLLNPPLELRIEDYKKARELRQQYLRRLEPHLERDKAIYRAAVKEATGLDSKAYAEKYAAFWERYEDAKVTTAIAARDVGLGEKEFRARLLRAIKSGYYVSPVASSYVHEGARARGIGIRQHEEVVAELYEVMKATEKVK